MRAKPFGIFNQNQTHRALAAAVTFRTFVSEVFLPTFQKRTTKLNLGVHVGIDRKTVLVRKMGLKTYEGRSDRQNEVWAGKPVNMAAKLASITPHGQILVSDRYYHTLKSPHALESCGCVIGGGYTGRKSHLWRSVDVTEKEMFDFDTAYTTLGQWCVTHGAEFCEALLRFDEAAS